MTEPKRCGTCGSVDPESRRPVAGYPCSNDAYHNTPASEPLGDDDLRECEDAVVAHYMGSPTAPETPTGAASEDLLTRLDVLREDFYLGTVRDVQGEYGAELCGRAADAIRQSDARVAEAVDEAREHIAAWLSNLCEHRYAAAIRARGA